MLSEIALIAALRIAERKYRDFWRANSVERAVGALLTDAVVMVPHHGASPGSAAILTEVFDSERR